MGQKVSPHGLRVGVIKDWDSRWYADKKNFGDLLVEDFEIRKFIKKAHKTAGISRIYIDRAANDRVNINIFTAKPGMLVGKGGETIKKLRAQLEKMTGRNIQLDISEVMNPETDAQLIAESVAFSLERRVSFRRAMKQAIGRSMRAGVQGIKVMTSGRLGGAEMARTEGYSEGNVPLSTLRADIDYGFAEADTTYGKIGVKVWLNNGEVLPGENGVELKRLQAKKKQDRKPRRGGQRGGAPRGRRNDNRRNNPKNN